MINNDNKASRIAKTKKQISKMGITCSSIWNSIGLAKEFSATSNIDSIKIIQRLKVRSMQRSGTKAIRTQIQPSKPKLEITYIQLVKLQRKHVVNRISSYFPKDGHSATETELK